MRNTQGFTLVEVLVVIVVIAAIVSISGVNTGSDPRDNFVKAESTRLKFYMESLTDDAILNSKNIGIHFTPSGANPYQWQKAIPKENENNIKEEWEWSPLQSNRIDKLVFQNEIKLKLYINESEIILSANLETEKTITPHVIIQSSGIQTLASLNISIDDYNKSIFVKGNGAGRYKVEGLADEFQ